MEAFIKQNCFECQNRSSNRLFVFLCMRSVHKTVVCMQNVMSGQWRFMNYKSTFLELNNIRNTHKNLFEWEDYIMLWTNSTIFVMFYADKKFLHQSGLQTCPPHESG